MTLSRRGIVAGMFVALLSGAGQWCVAQQPLLSPRDSVELRLNGKRIFVDYGRPSMRGRKIMGALVPYDRWWRTGANEATSFKTSADLFLGDSLIPAGEYTLYTMPSPKQWKVMINRQTGQWGTVYDPSLDLIRVPLRKRTLRAPVEKFTIRLERTGTRSGILRMRWERTELWVPFRLAANGSSTNHE